MVFKGRFFSSKKFDSSNCPDSSNSPRSFDSNSPISRSEKKKVKSTTKEDPHPQIAGSRTQAKDVLKKKDVKGTTHPQTPAKSPSTPSKLKKLPDTTNELSPVAATAAASASVVSPILASSLGLNRIKTRSGLLPQEIFFAFRGEKGLGLGASNLSRPGGSRGFDSVVVNKGKKKEVAAKQTKIGI